MEFEFKANTLNVTQGATQQTSSAIFCCSYIKFGTPPLPFNSNCAQQQDHTKLISKYHSSHSCMCIGSKKRIVEETCLQIRIIHQVFQMAQKNPELQLLKSDIREMTVNVGCAHTSMNKPNK